MDHLPVELLFSSAVEGEKEKSCPVSVSSEMGSCYEEKKTKRGGRKKKSMSLHVITWSSGVLLNYISTIC